MSDATDALGKQLREDREQGWASFLKDVDWQIYVGVRGQND